MVIRIFTVASAELISKPVSLVSMVRTGENEQEFLTEGLEDVTGTRKCRKDHRSRQRCCGTRLGTIPFRQTPKLEGKPPRISLRPPQPCPLEPV